VFPTAGNCCQRSQDLRHRGADKLFENVERVLPQLLREPPGVHNQLAHLSEQRLEGTASLFILNSHHRSSHY